MNASPAQLLPVLLGAALRLTPRRAAALWRDRAARRTAAGLNPLIAAGRRALADFDACSTREFSALAERLGALDTELAAIGAGAGRLEQLFRGEDEDRAHQSAFEVFKQSVDLAHASIGIAISQEEEMEQIERRLLQHEDKFTRNSLMFRILLLNLRAEAARIDPEMRAVFGSVAGEIAAMERQMDATVTKAFTELAAIVQEAAKGREAIHSLEKRLHDGAQQSIQVIRDELDGIQRGLAPCAASHQAIGRQLAEARRHTAGLITALQYQDIVRQQLEHVGEGFDDIAAHLAPGPGGAPVDLGYLHHGARVQQTQLQASRRRIEEATRAITSGSTALLATGAALAGSFATLQEQVTRAFSQNRVASLFRTETENLVQIAAQSEQTNDRIARLLERIDQSVTVFSTDIRRHEFEVKLVALNAQIAAAHVPHERALNKLAEETARLAADSSKLTQMMCAQLEETLGTLQRMRGEADQIRQTLGAEKAQLAGGAGQVTEKLQRLEARIHADTGAAAHRFSRAYDGVRELLDALEFPGRIAATFAPGEILSERLLAATGHRATAELGEDGASRLAAHRERYTMEHERAVHAAVVADAPAAPAPPDGPAPSDPVATAADTPAPATADAGVELF